MQLIEGEDSDKPFICHIMNLRWLISDKGTHVRFCWTPSHCGIEGNESGPTKKRDPDHDIDSPSVHYADLKPLLNSYIQKLIQIKWDVHVNGRDLSLETNTRTSKEIPALDQSWWGCNHLTKTTKAHILSRGPTTYHHCGQMLTIDHVLLKCAVLQENRD